MVKEIMEFITAQDPEVGRAVAAEYDRQRRNIELIASAPAFDALYAHCF